MTLKIYSIEIPVLNKLKKQLDIIIKTIIIFFSLKIVQRIIFKPYHYCFSFNIDVDMIFNTNSKLIYRSKL